jgi:beta-phosphoglucomutase
MSGARVALSYFGVPSTDARTEEYARRKQRVMDELLLAGELATYRDALRFVLAVRGAETPSAAASSLKNAARLLGQIRPKSVSNRVLRVRVLM